MEDLCLALPPLNGDEGLVFHRHQPVTPDASHATCTTARRHPSSDHDYTALRSQVLWGAHEPTIVSLSSRNLAPSFAPEMQPGAPPTLLEVVSTEPAPHTSR